MDCPKCSTTNTENSNFCRQCGARLHAKPAAVPEPELPPPPVDDDEVSRLLGRAFDLYDDKNYEEAFEVCRAALRLNSESGAGHALLASIYEKQGDLEAAIRQMRRVTDLNPDSQADKERLQHMEQRLQFLQADEDFTPPPAQFRLGDFLSKPSVLALTSLIAIVALAAWLFGSRGQEPGYATTPLEQTAGTEQPVFQPGTATQTTAAGDLFAGNGAPVPAQEPAPAATAPPAAVAQPSRAHTPTAPAPSPAAQPRAQPQPQPVTQPAQPGTPSGPPPSVRITRQPAPSAAVTPAPAPAPVRTSGTSGTDYQRMARQAQDNGDTNAARDYYRKAIAAYRTEAGSDGGAFAAQQGIRSSEQALKLLENPE